jgi:hypothetical protein
MYFYRQWLLRVADEWPFLEADENKASWQVVNMGMEFTATPSKLQGKKLSHQCNDRAGQGLSTHGVV